MSTEKSQLEKTNIGLASIHNEGEDISPQQLSMPAVPIQRVASGKTNTEELQSEKDQHSMNGVESRVLASYSSVPPDDDGSNGQKNGNTLQGKFQSPNPLQFKIPKSTLKSFSAPTLQLKTNTIQKQSEEEEPVQGKFNTIQKQSEEEEPVQGRFNTIQKQGEEEEPVQAKSTNPNGLPAPVQTQMENALGSDFSNVNIHTNSKSATDVGALAYTQGNDVHFAPGQYNPESSSGQELIGHELTHVVQQREGRVQPTTQAAGLPVNDDKGLEAEADAGGQKAVQMKKTNSSVIQRIMPEHTQQGAAYGTNENNPLYSRGAGDSDDISSNDIRQGGVGDCSVLAALISISHSNPQAIRDAISGPLPNGTYNVRLYRRERHGFLWLSSRLVATTINVTPNFPRMQNGAGDLVYANGGDNNELWVKLIEKAYAQLEGGYSGINGVDPGDALSRLTGRETERRSIQGGLFGIGSISENDLRDTILQAITNHQYVTVDRYSDDYSDLNQEDKTFAETNGIFGNHAYGVLNADNSGIRLRNPHGDGRSYPAEVQLSWAQFRRMYNNFTITR